MLISEKLIFVELQKTGSTHIKGLLKKILGGENDAKHNVPTVEQLDSGRKVVASVRDPWSWYLSLWSYGCLQKGELYERLTNEKKWRKLLERKDGAGAEPDGDDAGDGDGDVDGDGGSKGRSKTLPENFSPERARTFWYADPDNAAAFREWLQAVLAVQPLRKVLETGYGRSPISKAGGLMTFRYFTVCTRNGETVDKSVCTMDALRKYDAANCFVSHFVRNESLPEDLIRAIEASGVALEEEQKQAIREARRTSVSDRPHAPDYYYDDDSIQLVGRREKFLVEKFGYKNKKP